MTEDESPKQFKPFDWVQLIVATVLGTFVIPHIIANIYLISTATTIAGPEPIVVIGGLALLAIMGVIIWRKMKKLRQSASRQVYQKTILGIAGLAVIIAGLILLQIF